TGTVETYRRILSPVRLPIPPPRQHQVLHGAEDGVRTRDPHLGKVVFYHCTTSAILIKFYMVLVKGVEPPCPKALDPESSASADSATPALCNEPYRNRTCDPLIKSQMLYRLS